MAASSSPKAQEKNRGSVIYGLKHGPRFSTPLQVRSLQVGSLAEGSHTTPIWNRGLMGVLGGGSMEAARLSTAHLQMLLFSPLLVCVWYRVGM